MIDERFRKRLGSYVKKWTDREHIDQPEGAKLCKVSDKRFGKIERGDVKPPKTSELESLALLDVNRRIGVDWIGMLPNMWAAMQAQQKAESQNGDGDSQQ